MHFQNCNVHTYSQALKLMNLKHAPSTEAEDQWEFNEQTSSAYANNVPFQ